MTWTPQRPGGTFSSQNCFSFTFFERLVRVTLWMSLHCVSATLRTGSWLKVDFVSLSLLYCLGSSPNVFWVSSCARPPSCCPSGYLDKLSPQVVQQISMKSRSSSTVLYNWDYVFMLVCHFLCTPHALLHVFPQIILSLFKCPRDIFSSTVFWNVKVVILKCFV